MPTHLGSARPIQSFDIRRIHDGTVERVVDNVAVEQALDIRLTYWFKESRQTAELAVTMRTPGNDCELAAGLLLAEGIISSSAEIIEIRHIGAEDSNEIAVELAAHVDVQAWQLRRSCIVGASCGICGKRSREAIADIRCTLPRDTVMLDVDLVLRLPDVLRTHQSGFDLTGGLHAAALINASGEVESVYEDIGRHNALDKLIGNCVLGKRLPLHERIVFLSSRSSFELIGKAAMAGVSILATVGGPSSLAIEAARECGMTLIGFVRPGRCNVYSGEWRLNS